MGSRGGPGVRRAWWDSAPGIFALIFLAFSAGAVLSWESFGSASGPAFFYPPSGVTAAAMMLSRRTLWPAVGAAAFCGEIAVDTFYGNPVLVSAGFGAANVAEPIIGATLVLAWCARKPDLRVRRDFAAFIAGACLISPMVGGMIGGTFVAHHDGVSWWGAVLNWAAGDALGVLVVGSPILLWTRQNYIVRQRPWEAAGVLVATAGLSIAAFWADAPPSMLILPVLAWAALRLDMLGAALAGAVAAFLVNIMSTRGSGLFNAPDVPAGSRVVMVQIFVAVIVVVAMLIAQEAAGRLSAIREREAERRERIRLETLSLLAQQLSAALTPRDIGRALDNQVLNDAGATALTLGLLAHGRIEWVAMAGYPDAVVEEFGRGVALDVPAVATDAVRSAQPVLVPTAAEYGRRYGATAHWLRTSGTESVVGWPLTSGETPIGVLVLAWSEPQLLDPAQLAYVSAVATMVSQALIRARMYEDEHARALVLQSAVLPTGPTDTPGLDVCVTYEPADVAHGLGGDWFDVMRLPGNRTYLAVGDVVGHGLPAVEDMAQLRSAGRALAHQGLPPARLLAELNGFTRHASQGKFATMAVAIVDADAGSLMFCSAGHPPPFLRRAGTSEVIDLDGAGGPVLGPLRDAVYTGGTLLINPGDMLVMYTDGLVERRGRDVDSGMAAARRIISGWEPNAELADGCRSLQDALAPRPRPDDVCVVAVRFLGDGSPRAHGVPATAAVP